MMSFNATRSGAVDSYTGSPPSGTASFSGTISFSGSACGTGVSAGADFSSGALASCTGAG